MSLSTRLALPVVLISALSACVSVPIGEKNFIHPDQPGAAQAAQPLQVQELQAQLPGATLSEETLQTSDGVTLRGLTMHPQGALRDPARPTILYFGGNMFHVDANAAMLFKVLAACQVDISVFDYRGYGRSTGVPSVATMQADALLIFDHLNAQAPGGVIVHGQSLGSFIAAHVAQHRPARGLVLESTITNAHDWATANTPWYARPFVRYAFSEPLRSIDNVAAVANFAGPSMVLIGARDKITPPHYAHKVFEAIGSDTKQWRVVLGAGHNDALQLAAAADTAYCAFVRGETSASDGHSKPARNTVSNSRRASR